jgi:hypothetical protein
MRWVGLILLLMGLQSCEEEKSYVIFNVKMDGFEMKGDPDFPEPDHTVFNHKYSAGLISFTGGGQSHKFYINDGKMEDYQIKLPTGEYKLGANVPAASLYGQPTGSYEVVPATVSITELTDTLTIRVEANCSLILVNDEQEQLDEGPFFIERHSYSSGSFKSYPMAWDSTSGLYYTYFTPDPVPDDPSAFIWFYNEWPGVERGGLSTTRFEVGYQYFIIILE